MGKAYLKSMPLVRGPRRAFSLARSARRCCAPSSRIATAAARCAAAAAAAPEYWLLLLSSLSLLSLSLPSSWWDRIADGWW